MGLGSFVKGAVSALPGLGELAGSFGDSKLDAVPSGGFAALPQQVQDSYLNVLLPGEMELFGLPFFNKPMRRYQEDDPLFRSAALTDFQNYSDASGGFFSPYGEGGQGSGESEMLAGLSQLADELRGRQIVSEMAGPGGMYATRQNQPWQLLQEKGKAEDFADVGKKAGKAIKGGGLFEGAFLDPATGIPIQIDAINTYRRSGR